MEIKITPKGLSIPPYVSAHWSKIQSLHLKGNALCVSLQSGESLLIPNLPREILQQIFQAHALFLDQELPSLLPTPLHGIEPLQSMLEQITESSIRLAIGSLDGMEMITQHNPADRDAPDLPEELLQKVRSILDFIPPGKSLQIPQADPSCNCFHCQITRSLSHPLKCSLSHESPDSHLEQAVKEEELLFEQWAVRQTDRERFAVTNKLNPDETYQVFLGEPVGCTCGKQGKEGCDHILAALRS